MSTAAVATGNWAAQASSALAQLSARQRGERPGHAPHRQPIGIIGPSVASDAQINAARIIAGRIAACGVALVCGGKGGVMSAAAQGAQEAGGQIIGLLPEDDMSAANPYLTIALPTGIGEMRNALIARSSICLIAIGGGMGTLSEMALALRWGKPLFTLYEEVKLPGAYSASSIEELIAVAVTAVVDVA